MRYIDREFSEKPVNLTLDMSSLIDDSMQVSDADVRNHIVVKVQGYDPITAEDEESIAKYGRRYMEVHRSMSDIITDVSQAHELAEGILRDLRFANPLETAEIALHPLIQVGDIVQITNPRLGTNPTDDIFKVTTVSNSYSSDRKRTSLTLKGYDIFLSQPSIAPNAPTGLGYEMQTRTIQNYPNSGWTGYEKESSFPMLKWTPPTQDVDGNILEDSFGGYIVERAVQIILEGQMGLGEYVWGTIASIPSYIGSLNLKVDYFYDYSSAIVIDRFKRIGAISGGTVSVRYRITAINKRGVKSAVSNTATILIPVDRLYDEQGNLLA
jgi:hypothetical protein